MAPEDRDPLADAEDNWELLLQAGRGGTLEDLITALATISIARSLRQIEGHLRVLNQRVFM